MKLSPALLLLESMMLTVLGPFLLAIITSALVNARFKKLAVVATQLGLASLAHLCTIASILNVFS
jgi:hypothetical protein